MADTSWAGNRERNRALSTPREGTGAVWVPAGSPAPCRAAPRSRPAPHHLCPPAASATDTKIFLASKSGEASRIDAGTTIQMVSVVAEDRKKASKCSSLWAKSRFHRGPTDLSVWPKFTGKSAQEQRITHAICKHIKISKSHAFARNNVNYCQIKLIFVR